jgi:flagellar assembly protein FliH
LQASLKPSEALRRVRERARAILREASDSALAVALAAEERGFEEGRRRGYEDGAREARSLLDEARREMELVREERRAAMREAEVQVARLAIEVASLVLKRQLDTDPATVVSLVRDAIARAGDGEIVTVRVPSSSAGLLASLSGSGNGGLRFHLEEDPALEQGDCIVETSMGTIDERISTQLERVAAAFEEVERHG